MPIKPFPYHKYIVVSLVYLLIVALIGTLLRSVSYLPLPFELGNLVHTHSHVAFQGWVYTVIFLALTRIYISEEKLTKGRYLLQFQLTAVAVIGVLIAFFMQGYGLYSIIFSTIFQALNYWFIYSFFRDTKRTENGLSINFIKMGLRFGLLSSMLPYVIGFVSAKGLAGTETYKSLVYTFMHLQYNGWFLFIVLGLFYELLKRLNMKINTKLATSFFWCLTFAVIPAISLSLLGMTYSSSLTISAWVSVVLQSFGLIFFLKSFSIKTLIAKDKKANWLKIFLALFILSFVLKISLQTLSTIPSLSDYAFQNKFIFLSYLHLSLIGVVSFLLIAVVIYFKWITISVKSKIGFSLLILGFIITELILALGGIAIFYSTEMLISGSTCMLLGILLLILSVKNTSQNSHAIT